MKKKIDSIKNIKKIQGYYGNWNYSSYMMGMYNGIELALSILENREPEFKTVLEFCKIKIKKLFIKIFKIIGSLTWRDF